MYLTLLKFKPTTGIKEYMVTEGDTIELKNIISIEGDLFKGKKKKLKLLILLF